MMHPDIVQIARAEDVAALRRFFHRRRRSRPWWLVGAVSGVAFAAALVALGCAS